MVAVATRIQHVQSQIHLGGSRHDQAAAPTGLPGVGSPERRGCALPCAGHHGQLPLHRLLHSFLARAHVLEGEADTGGVVEPDHRHGNETAQMVAEREGEGAGIGNSEHGERPAGGRMEGPEEARSRRDGHPEADHGLGEVGRGEPGVDVEGAHAEPKGQPVPEPEADAPEERRQEQPRVRSTVRLPRKASSTSTTGRASFPGKAPAARSAKRTTAWGKATSTASDSTTPIAPTRDRIQRGCQRTLADAGGGRERRAPQRRQQKADQHQSVEDAFHDQRPQRTAHPHGLHAGKRIRARKLACPRGEDVVGHEADGHGREAIVESALGANRLQQHLPAQRTHQETRRGHSDRRHQQTPVRPADLRPDLAERDVPENPPEQERGDGDPDHRPPVELQRARASRTSAVISRTARSMPTSTARAITEWPMFSSSTSASAATGTTFS